MSDQDTNSDSQSENEDTPTRPRKQILQHQQLIVTTTFDTYFTETAKKSQTSTSVFSTLVEPLSADEYSTAVSLAQSRRKVIQPSLLKGSFRVSLFSTFFRQLEAGFNLIFYGMGSKKTVVDELANEFCSKAGHVVIANGFQSNFALKDMLNTIERVPGISERPVTSTTVEGQTRRIHDFFSQSTSPHIYIVIHNIDAYALRTAKAKSCMSLLALSRHIHLIASIDHINAPLLWSSSETSKRKPTSEANTSNVAPMRGFAWLWHDLTTLAPYDTELANIDRSSLSSAHGGGVRKIRETAVTQITGSAAMTESAALHIIAAVTQKAKKLFVLMGNQQLSRAEDAGDPGIHDLQQFAIPYDVLFRLARDNFVATNDTALRALLTEFRDHGLVVAAQTGAAGGEVLWIPLRKERLTTVIQSAQVE